METSKTRPVTTARKSPVKVETDLRNNVQVLHSKLNEIDELAIDEDFDLGGDPYNGAGQHAIVRPRKDGVN